MGRVAELGARENPWTSLGTCDKPAFKSGLEQDLAQELL